MKCVVSIAFIIAVIFMPVREASAAVPSAPFEVDGSTLLLCHFEGTLSPDYERSGDCQINSVNTIFPNGRFGRGVGGFNLVGNEESAGLAGIGILGPELLGNSKFEQTAKGLVESWSMAPRKDAAPCLGEAAPLSLDALKTGAVACQEILNPELYAGKELLLKAQIGNPMNGRAFLGVECLPARPSVSSGFIYGNGAYAERSFTRGGGDASLLLHVAIPEGTKSLKVFLGAGAYYVPGGAVFPFAKCSLKELRNVSLQEGSISLWMKFEATKPVNCSLFNFSDFWSGPSLTFTGGYGGCLAFNFGSRYDGHTASAAIHELGSSLFDGNWHCATVSWRNVNSGRANGSLAIVLDGQHAGLLQGEYLRCSSDVEKIILGAWHVGGRNIYPAQAVIDELRISNRHQCVEELMK